MCKRSWKKIVCIQDFLSKQIIMWNDLNLKCPVKDVCTYSSQDTAILNISELVSLLTSAADVLTKDHPIWTEIKIFQNVQAKYRRILHCDKCLLLLQRVGSCLRKVILLNLSKIYLDLAEHFLKGLQNQDSVQLPSRQQLEYALLRTQSAAKLSCEALHYSRETFCFLIQKLRVGHMLLHLMMAASVTARVNILFKGVLIQLFDIYRNLYSWRQQLKSGTFEWPKPLEIPEDLEAWLNPELSDLLGPKQISKDQLNTLRNFFEREKNETTLKETENTVSDEDECVVVKEPCLLQISNDLDIGEVVSREKSTYQDQPTESQNILLKKIKNVKSFKKLAIIWNNFDVNSQVLLPTELTPLKIQLIDKAFLQAKKKIVRIKNLPLQNNIKKKQIMTVTRLTGDKFLEHLGFTGHLGLMDSKSNASSCSMPSIDDLQPVKTLAALKALYLKLYKIFQSSQQYEKCDKLKKIYKSRRADIKLLIAKGDKKCAKKLIFCSSKVFLRKFL
ncbi:DUF4477 domain-containing protein [Nephila pilipes]|uniref:DUF4477 domain-containing protein n=1 Tax=Nephila pilipes TaxID=299642 RepID=A0A8X6QZ45_NEPPI|nr:DUF4477 domain-containing protein [Nephila pilipes]